MAAKRNASGLSALPRPSLDNEELVRNDDNLVDVDEVDVNEVDVVEVDVDEVDVDEVDVNEVDVNEDRRKLDQICNSLKRLIRDYLGKILGAAILGRGEKNIKEHCPLYWIERVEGVLAGRAFDWSRELQIYWDDNICTAAALPPNCVCK